MNSGSKVKYIIDVLSSHLNKTCQNLAGLLHKSESSEIKEKKKNRGEMWTVDKVFYDSIIHINISAHFTNKCDLYRF